MAAVIHALWQGGDRNPLIQPANIPIDDARVQFELTRYLSDNWPPIIERDIDGPNSTPVRIDEENPNLGRYQATRRVARTIYLGSAPTTDRANAGLEDRRIKLGAALPGESPAIFGDALRRLASNATYLFSDGNRYWYATTPTVAKLAEDRAEQLRREPDRVYKELETRLRTNLDQHRGDFTRIHTLPANSSDIPDDFDTRLVVLSPDHPHTRTGESAAIAAAHEILDRRGNTPRQYRNTLTFLAADTNRLEELHDATRRYLAWSSIVSDIEILNLRPDQARQASDQLRTIDATVTARLPETYQWLLVPTQADPRAKFTLEATRLTGNEPLAPRASKRLRNDELLITNLGFTSLKLELERIPLWRGNHVSVQQLIQDFAAYPYLPRLRDPNVLTEAVSRGIASLAWRTESYAYAERYDPNTNRYAGLQTASALTIRPDDRGMLVKPDIAAAQQDADHTTTQDHKPTPTHDHPDTPHATQPSTNTTPHATTATPTTPRTRKPKRFYASVDLDAQRPSPAVARIHDEVLAHLSSQLGSRVRITLEIHVERNEGFDEQTVRIVNENATTLRFASHGFEEE
jgi:hypothetical protein